MRTESKTHAPTRTVFFQATLALIGAAGSLLAIVNHSFAQAPSGGSFVPRGSSGASASGASGNGVNASKSGATKTGVGGYGPSGTGNAAGAAGVGFQGKSSAGLSGQTVPLQSPTRPAGQSAAGQSAAGPAIAGPATGGPATGGQAPTGQAPLGPTNSGKGPTLTQPVLRTSPPLGMIPVQAPAWIPLPAEHEKYLDQVLGYWQESSAKIKRYRCRFTRWEYDGVFMARDAKTGEMPAKTQSSGVLKYAAPDKGLFRVEQMLHYTPATKPGERAQYTTHPDDRGEQWICDGKSVFAFDHQKRQLIQTELPPDMQGRAIVDGPLPFMFGAEAAKIKQRFWIRVITPKDAKGEYWLEAVPKTRTDAANFRMLHVIIDEQDFLPKAMAMFDRNYDEVRNPTCTNYVFEKREVNWNETLDKINIFAREFWEPATPLGYKKIVERYDATPAERLVTPTPAAKQATLPAPPGNPATAPRTKR
jgi:TIGR03009 family protein